MTLSRAMMDGRARGERGKTEAAARDTSQETRKGEMAAGRELVREQKKSPTEVGEV